VSIAKDGFALDSCAYSVCFLPTRETIKMVNLKLHLLAVFLLLCAAVAEPPAASVTASVPLAAPPPPTPAVSVPAVAESSAPAKKDDFEITALKDLPALTVPTTSPAAKDRFVSVQQLRQRRRDLLKQLKQTSRRNRKALHKKLRKLSHRIHRAEARAVKAALVREQELHDEIVRVRAEIREAVNRGAGASGEVDALKTQLQHLITKLRDIARATKARLVELRQPYKSRISQAQIAVHSLRAESLELQNSLQEADGPEEREKINVKIQALDSRLAEAVSDELAAREGLIVLSLMLTHNHVERAHEIRRRLLRDSAPSARASLMQFLKHQRLLINVNRGNTRKLLEKQRTTANSINAEADASAGPLRRAAERALTKFEDSVSDLQSAPEASSRKVLFKSLSVLARRARGASRRALSARQSAVVRLRFATVFIKDRIHRRITGSRIVARQVTPAAPKTEDDVSEDLYKMLFHPPPGASWDTRQLQRSLRKRRRLSVRLFDHPSRAKKFAVVQARLSYLRLSSQLRKARSHLKSAILSHRTVVKKINVALRTAVKYVPSSFAEKIVTAQFEKQKTQLENRLSALRSRQDTQSKEQARALEKDIRQAELRLKLLSRLQDRMTKAIERKRRAERRLAAAVRRTVSALRRMQVHLPPALARQVKAAMKRLNLDAREVSKAESAAGRAREQFKDTKLAIQQTGQEILVKKAAASRLLTLANVARNEALQLKSEAEKSRQHGDSLEEEAENDLTEALTLQTDASAMRFRQTQNPMSDIFDFEDSDTLYKNTKGQKKEKDEFENMFKALFGGKKLPQTPARRSPPPRRQRHHRRHHRVHKKPALGFIPPPTPEPRQKTWQDWMRESQKARDTADKYYSRADVVERKYEKKQERSQDLLQHAESVLAEVDDLKERRKRLSLQLVSIRAKVQALTTKAHIAKRNFNKKLKSTLAKIGSHLHNLPPKIAARLSASLTSIKAKIVSRVATAGPKARQRRLQRRIHAIEEKLTNLHASKLRAAATVAKLKARILAAKTKAAKREVRRELKAAVARLRKIARKTRRLENRQTRLHAAVKATRSLIVARRREARANAVPAVHRVKLGKHFIKLVRPEAVAARAEFAAVQRRRVKTLKLRLATATGKYRKEVLRQLSKAKARLAKVQARLARSERRAASTVRFLARRTRRIAKKVAALKAAIKEASTARERVAIRKRIARLKKLAEKTQDLLTQSKESLSAIRHNFVKSAPVAALRHRKARLAAHLRREEHRIAELKKRARAAKTEAERDRIEARIRVHENKKDNLENRLQNVKAVIRQRAQGHARFIARAARLAKMRLSKMKEDLKRTKDPRARKALAKEIARQKVITQRLVKKAAQSVGARTLKHLTPRERLLIKQAALARDKTAARAALLKLHGLLVREIKRLQRRSDIVNKRILQTQLALKEATGNYAYRLEKSLKFLRSEVQELEFRQTNAERADAKVRAKGAAVGLTLVPAIPAKLSASQLSARVEKQHKALTEKIKLLATKDVELRRRLVDLNSQLSQATSLQDTARLRKQIQAAEKQHSKLVSTVRRIANKRKEMLLRAKRKVAKRIAKLATKLEEHQEKLSRLRSEMSNASEAQKEHLQHKINLLVSRMQEMRQRRENLKKAAAKIVSTRTTGKWVKLTAPSEPGVRKDIARSLKLRHFALSAKVAAYSRKLLALEIKLSKAPKRQQARILARIKRLERRVKRLKRKAHLARINYKRVLQGKPRVGISLKQRLADLKETLSARLHVLNRRVKLLNKRIKAIKLQIKSANPALARALKDLLHSIKMRRAFVAAKVARVKKIARVVASGRLPRKKTKQERLNAIVKKLKLRSAILQDRVKRLNDHLDRLRQQLDKAPPRKRLALVIAIQKGEKKFKRLDQLVGKMQDNIRTAKEGRVPESEIKRALLKKVEAKLRRREFKLLMKHDKLKLKIITAQQDLLALKRGSHAAKLQRLKLIRLYKKAAKLEKRLAKISRIKNNLIVGELDGKFLLRASFKSFTKHKLRLQRKIGELQTKITSLTASVNTLKPPEKTLAAERLDRAKERQAEAQHKLELIQSELRKILIQMEVRKMKIPTVRPEFIDF
jgi:hypothetical protein